MTTKEQAQDPELVKIDNDDNAQAFSLGSLLTNTGVDQQQQVNSQNEFETPVEITVQVGTPPLINNKDSAMFDRGSLFRGSPRNKTYYCRVTDQSPKLHLTRTRKMKRRPIKTEQIASPQPIAVPSEFSKILTTISRPMPGETNMREVLFTPRTSNMKERPAAPKPLLKCLGFDMVDLSNLISPAYNKKSRFMKKDWVVRKRQLDKLQLPGVNEKKSFM